MFHVSGFNKMSFTNFQKTIALTSGVLVLSVAVGYVVFAWDGPTQAPPDGNADAPINVGSDPQTKIGDLTVSELTASGGKIYLNNSGFEGDIERVDQIIGENDLQLRDSADETKINLDVGDTGEIEFYTGGQERMRIEKGGDLHKQGDLYVENGDLHFPDLTIAPDFTGCFLEIDDDGKVKCYTGGGIPGGNVLSTAQVEVADIDGFHEETKICDSYTVPVGDVEKVVRVHADINGKGWGLYQSFWFYINGVEQWYKHCDWMCEQAGGYNISKYYHVIGGDTFEVCVLEESFHLASASGTIYTLGAKRALVTHAFAEEPNILYWYDQAGRGEMSPAGAHYIGGDPIQSVIISAEDEADVSWIID